MYANYLPETLLELGDYGDVTKDGEFIRLGNIFKDHPWLRDEVEPRKESFPKNKHFFVSREPRRNTFSIIAE
jgi:hypothetical protein